MSSIMNNDGDNNNSDIPQWKKDLIARLRNQNRRTANCGGILVERYQQQQQQQQHSPQSSASMVAVINAESSSTPSSSSSIQHNNQYESVCRSSKNKVNSDCVIKSCKTMVQDCVIYDNNWENFEDHQHKHHHQYKNGNSRDYYGDHCPSSDDDNKDVDDDDDDEGNNDSDKNSIDDLHYGPGIVNKLKNKYLSLVLRESIKNNNNSGNIKRLPMRKAASLENILDDCNDDDNNKHGKLSNNNSNNNTESLYKKFNNKNDLNKVNCRYRKTTRGNDNNNKKIIVKRARSVETISRHNHEIDDIERQPQQLNKQRESMPEEILINFNNNQDLLEQKCVDNNHKSSTSSSSSSNIVTPRINRPKRIQPVVNEKEKPPVDFVKQTKLIFERHRPELYKKSSSSTGNNTNNNNNNNNEVATKVANYKNIVNNNKNNKNKPPIKQKPVLLKINEKSPRKSKNHQDHDGGDNDDRKMKISPPDVSQLNDIKTNQLSSNTPDLIITSSPISSSPISVFYHLKQATETFLQEEIRNNFDNNPLEINSIGSDEVKNQIDGNEVEDSLEKSEDDCGGSFKKVSPQTMINIDKVSTTITYNFIKTNKTTENHLAPTTMDLNEKKTPINQPLKLDTITTTTTITSTASPKIIEKINKLVSPPLRSSSSSSVSTSKPAPILTMLEIEKNMKNTVKTLEQPKSIVSSINNNNNNSNNIDNNSVNCLQKVPKLVKRKPPANKQQSDNNSIVFKFTDRKDVPDYLHHDGLIRVGKIERPKVGEGGIILLPGASIEESFTDDDVDEIMRSLEAPPSPCDVTFINDNILIDGKSSLITQKTRKNNSSSSKLKISFVDDGPEVYEYPSESSFSIEDPKQPQQQQISGHTTGLPSLSGSSLGNYTPKSTEEFHPGVTRTSPITPTSCTSNNDNKNSNETVLQETEKPIVFSAGTNSDILF